MTTSAKRPMLSPPKQIPVQSLRSSATSNNFFFDSQIKKNLSKTITTKLYPAKQCEKKWGRMHKNKRLSDNIYSIANL